MPEDFAGYERCRDCGRLVLSSFALQTGRRCINCWKDRHPLATLEVMNRSVRHSAKTMVGHRRKERQEQGYDPRQTIDKKARNHARQRLANLFPDLYAMLLDECRAELGLPPIARYEALDFEATASKTLGFEDVYDALESSGATDE